ncbi:hypothetical protein DFH28DRAFT_880651 [Melampsora americana]|nr:hypothetical protein DFH28DRAFT_880651 [Melampsora americana]
MPVDLTPEAVTRLIENSLRQQADQFDAIIGDLRTQLSEFKDLSSRKKKPHADATPDTSTGRNRLKPSPSQNPYTTPSPPARAPRKLNTPVPSNRPPPVSAARRRHLLQLQMRDLPNDFKSTKEALFFHIKVLWGLFKANDVPVAVDAALLKEFYT